MRRAIPILAAAVAFSLIAGAALAAVVGGFSVELGRSKRIILQGPAATVSIADPAVADVAMLDARSVVVVGKAVGVTDIIVSDHSGRLLMNTRVAVVPLDAEHLTVIRGATPSDYVCVARCSAALSGSGQGRAGFSGQIAGPEQAESATAAPQVSTSVTRSLP